MNKYRVTMTIRISQDLVANSPHGAKHRLEHNLTRNGYAGLSDYLINAKANARLLDSNIPTEDIN